MVLAGLAAPATALADVPAGPWQITGLVLDGQKIAATGKLSLDGQLSASVGCNSMGGPYRIDGATITVGSLTTTLMGCPGDIGKAEDALMKLLSTGPLTIAPDKWSGATGEIDVIAAGGDNGGGAPGCIPPVAPGANPGNVTVPCGSGGSGSDGGNGATIDSNGPTNAASDPLALELAIGLGVLLFATVAVYVYIGPRRTPGGSSEE